jgi:3-hydroxy-9,10-secoandrosta-1,3,5(10)-triene-9,17-dione monooxygenase
MSDRVVAVVAPDYTDRLSRAELDSITSDVLVARVAALGPFVAARAAAAEAARRPDDEVIARLHATGVFHHFVPRRYGGLELGVMDFVDEMLPLGEACASTCWVTTFCMEHNLLLALYPESVQDEIFGSQPYVIAPGCAMPPGRAEPVDGGYRLTGRWRYATGVMHADWAMGLGIDTTNPSDAHWFLFPLADATVFDVWHMDGMAATGSNDIAVDDVFVPAARALDFTQMSSGTTPGAALHPNPMYRVPIAPFLAIASAIPIIGAARGVVKRFRDDLPSRVSFGVAQAERQAVQMALGQAATEVRLAELALRQAVRDLLELAESADRAAIAERARLRADVVNATSLARDAVRRVVDTLGTSVHRSDHPIQRAARDISVATGHVLHDRTAAMELHGRVLLGLQPQPTLY